MALFNPNGPDAGLPTLTQFYQLEIEPENCDLWSRDFVDSKIAKGDLVPVTDKEDLLRLFDFAGPQLTRGLHCTKAGVPFVVMPDGSGLQYEAEYGARLYRQRSELVQWVGSITAGIRGFEDSPSSSDEHDVGVLARVHPVLRRLMDAAADNMPPHPDDLELFNSWRQGMIQRSPELLWDEFSKIDLRWGETRITSYLSRPLSEFFVAVLTGNWMGAPVFNLPVGFARCEECGSAYVAQKAEQMYCSYRCRSRVGGRKRYAERMADYPVRNNRVTASKT